MSVKAALKTRIVQHLNENPELTAREVARALDMHPQVTSNQLKELRHAGHVAYGDRREGARRTYVATLQEEPEEAIRPDPVVPEPVFEPESASSANDLDDATLTRLRELARERGVEGRSSMTRDELIAALRSG